MKRLSRFFLVPALAAICSCGPTEYNEGEVSYKIWEGYEADSLPDDFSILGEPTATGTRQGFQLGEYVDPAKDHFLAEYTSTLAIPEEKEYTFLLYSDDNSGHPGKRCGEPVIEYPFKPRGAFLRSGGKHHNRHIVGTELEDDRNSSAVREYGIDHIELVTHVVRRLLDVRSILKLQSQK